LKASATAVLGSKAVTVKATGAGQTQTQSLTLSVGAN